MKNFTGLFVALLASTVALCAVPASPAYSATKPRAAAAAASGWATTDRGSTHAMRNNNKVFVRGVLAPSWETHAMPTLKAHNDQVDPACADPQTPDLEGAKLFVQTDSTGSWLYLLSGSKVTKQVWKPENPSGESRWIVSEAPTASDWTYFVMFQDTNSAGAPGSKMEKSYRVEVYPPKGRLPKCDLTRPDMTQPAPATKAPPAHAAPCQGAVGDGSEPKH